MACATAIGFAAALQTYWHLFTAAELKQLATGIPRRMRRARVLDKKFATDLHKITERCAPTQPKSISDTSEDDTLSGTWDNPGEEASHNFLIVRL